MTVAGRLAPALDALSAVKSQRDIEDQIIDLEQCRTVVPKSGRVRVGIGVEVEGK